MNKNERKIILNEINRILQRVEWRETRMDDPTISEDKLNKYKSNMEKDFARLDGIDFVLLYQGYKRRYNTETNLYYLTKYNGYEYVKVD